MNTKVTTSIIFDHRRRAKDNEKGPLEIRITYARKHIYISTGVRVYRKEWIAGRIINCAGADELNKRLAIIYTKVCEIVNDCIEHDKPINAADIRRDVYKLIESGSNEPTLINWIESQLPLLNVSEGTLKHYFPLVNRLTEYGKITRWQDVTMEAICEFDAFLHTITKPQSDAEIKAKKKKEYLSDGAIYNYHKCFKALLNRADRFGKISRNPYEQLKGQFKRGEKENIEYLTFDEMKRFEKLKPPVGSTLDIAHDLFIFQMYTGLSFSDAQAFDISLYKFDGKRWNRTGQRIKTGVPFVSSLLPPVVEVLKKYNYQLPKLDNADYNRHLKSLGVMAKISTPLHSHLARHTFATFMLSNGVKIENVSKMLGHTNITQTQRYAKVLAKSVHDDFDMIAKKLE